jgi:uncharacterized protein
MGDANKEPKNRHITRRSCGVAVMAKASVPGRTKTRLVPPLSYEEAAEFNTAFLCDVIDSLGDAAEKVNLMRYIAFGPPGSEKFFRDVLPESVGLIEAWKPNFGDCLLFAIEEMFRKGHGAAIVLNSDSPNLPTEILTEAVRILAEPGQRGVLGPSSDGGYYLLGLKQAHRTMFERIAWSTERVAEQTVARAREIGLDLHALPTWYDVDDIVSLRKLHAELLRPSPPHGRRTPYGAPHTTALINELCRDANFERRISRTIHSEELRT